MFNAIVNFVVLTDEAGDAYAENLLLREPLFVISTEDNPYLSALGITWGVGHVNAPLTDGFL